MAADLREPPPRATPDVMALAGGRPNDAATRFWSGFRWAASVAVVAGFIASVVATYVSGRYEARLGQKAREVAALRAQVGEQRFALSLLQDPTTHVLRLAGLEPSPQAAGRIVWSAYQGGVFVAAGLPPAPADKVYVLWAIVGTRALAAGAFTVNAEGTGGLRVAPIGQMPPVERFAVTLEPARGASVPTGRTYLASR